MTATARLLTQLRDAGVFIVPIAGKKPTRAHGWMDGVTDDELAYHEGPFAFEPATAGITVTDFDRGSHIAFCATLDAAHVPYELVQSRSRGVHVYTKGITYDQKRRFSDDTLEGDIISRRSLATVYDAGAILRLVKSEGMRAPGSVFRSLPLEEKKRAYIPRDRDADATDVVSALALRNRRGLGAVNERGFYANDVSCCFHDDADPSASVRQDGGLFCHVCGWHSRYEVAERLNVPIYATNKSVVDFGTDKREDIVLPTKMGKPNESAGCRVGQRWLYGAIRGLGYRQGEEIELRLIAEQLDIGFKTLRRYVGFGILPIVRGGA